MSRKVLCLTLLLALGILCGCETMRSIGLLGPRKGTIVAVYYDVQAGDGPEAALDTRCAVTIDGLPAGESAAADRYEHKELSAKVLPGTHTVVIEGLALRGGVWAKRTQAAGDGTDHRLEKKVEVGAGDTQVVNFVVPDRTGPIRFKL